MSNYSQALTVIGGAIGAYVTYGSPAGWQAGASIGAALGGATGAAIDIANTRIEGPRLTDARTVTAEYGDVIPWIAGAARVGGQVWWTSDRREVGTTTEEGKGGGPKNTTYTYEQDILLGISATTASAVSRIWSNGKLVWTRRTGATNESLANSDGSSLWNRLTIYLGGPDQLPDPAYESVVGAGNAPAYRGRTSVMIEGLQLGTSGQLPNLTFEILSESNYGIGTPEYAATYAAPVTFTSGTAAAASGTEWHVPIGQWDNSYSNNDVIVSSLNILTGESGAVSTYSTGPTGADVATGVSDQTIFVRMFGTVCNAYLGDAGTLVAMTLPISLGGQDVRFAKYGTTFIIGSRGFGVKRLYKYDLTTAILVATSSPLPDYISSLAIAGGVLYAAALGSHDIYVIDLSTLALTATITRPYTNIGTVDSWPQLVNLDEKLAYLDAVSPHPAWRYNGAGWESIGHLSAGFLQTSNLGQSVGVVGSVLVGGSAMTSPTRYQTWIAPLTVSPGSATLRGVVEDLCERANMPAGTYDASALSTITKPVRSLLLAQLGATRAALQPLMMAYHFDATLTDKLYFRPRATTAVATIPLDDLAAGVDQASGETFALTQGSDLELPAQVAIRYRNVENDYQTGVEVSDRLLSGQVAQQSIEVAIGMTPSEAKALADVMVTDNLAALTRGTISLSMAYAHLQPADVVVIDGQTMRLGRKQDASGVMTFEARRHDSSTILSAGVTDSSTYTEAAIVTAPSATALRVLDIPLLRDADDGPGHYVAANGGSVWPGCSVQRSINNVDFTQATTVLERAVFGTCTTTLADFTGIGFDEVNSVAVSVGTGELASSTRDAMLLDSSINTILIGSEVIRFVTATLTGTAPNRYTLTRLLRGQRGTEWAMPGHVATELCTLLRPQGLRYVSTPQADIGAARYIKGVTNGLSAASVTGESYTNAGVSQKPFSPSNLRSTRLSQGMYSLTWNRRSRLASTFADGRGVLLPIGETSEAYGIDLYDDTDTLIRTSLAISQAAVVGGPGKDKTLAAGLRWPVEYSGKLYGVSASGAISGENARFYRLGSDGLIETSFDITGTAWHMATDSAGVAYVITIGSASSGFIDTVKIRRIDLASMSVTATIDLFALFSGSNVYEGISYSIAWDGSALWSISVGGSRLRKHNATTLAVEHTEVLTTTGTPTQYIASDGAGTVFVSGKDYTKIVSFDTTGLTVNWTEDYSTVNELIIFAGSSIFGIGNNVRCIDPADGSIIQEYAVGSFTKIVQFNANAAYVKAETIVEPGTTRRVAGQCVVLDGVTGEELQAFTLEPDMLDLSGTIESKLATISLGVGPGNRYIGHLYGPSPDLPGGRAVVYQISSTVGRGYPAEITL